MEASRSSISSLMVTALFIAVAVPPAGGGQIAALPLSSTSNVGEGIAGFADEILQELMFDSGEDVVGLDQVEAAVARIHSTNTDVPALSLRKQVCEELDLDSIVVGSIRKVGSSLHVRVKRYNKAQKLLAQGKAAAASEDELEDALIEATQAALGTGETEAADEPESEEETASTQSSTTAAPKGYGKAPAGSPIIQIQYVEDDGCRWSRHEKGAKLEYVIASSDLSPQLKAGDIIVQVDGQLYQPGIFSFVRQKLIDGFSPQAELVVLRNNKPKYFVMERKPETK